MNDLNNRQREHDENIAGGYCAMNKQLQFPSQPPGTRLIGVTRIPGTNKFIPIFGKIKEHT